MSYELFDVNDYVGEFSTTLGCWQLRKSLEKRRRNYPNFLEFMNEGASLITDDLVREVNMFIQNERGKRHEGHNINGGEPKGDVGEG